MGRRSSGESNGNSEAATVSTVNPEDHRELSSGMVVNSSYPEISLCTGTGSRGSHPLHMRAFVQGYVSQVTLCLVLRCHFYGTGV